MTYLSFYSEGLKEVFLTGGLAPLVDRPDPVYEALISEFSVVLKIFRADGIYLRFSEHVAKRNRIYYEKYPQDIRRVKSNAD